jgi:hypothetical protein
MGCEGLGEIKITVTKAAANRTTPPRTTQILPRDSSTPLNTQIEEANLNGNTKGPITHDAPSLKRK